MTRHSVTQLARYAALLAAMVISFTTQVHLARTHGVPGWPSYAVPVAVDLYLVWAVRSGRDVALSVAVAVAANVASVLTAESLSAVDTWVSAAMHAVFPLTVWRMHRTESPPAPLRTPSEGMGTPEPAEVPQSGAQHVSGSWPSADLWADFEDSAPDSADTQPVTPPKPDHVRAVIAEMTSAGRPVTGQAIADHYGVSPRTGRRYLSLAT